MEAPVAKKQAAAAKPKPKAVYMCVDPEALGEDESVGGSKGIVGLGCGISSDDENVILKLSLSDTCGESGPHAYNTDPMLAAASEFGEVDVQVSDTGADAGPSMPPSAAPVQGPSSGPGPGAPSGPKIVRMLMEFEEKSKSGDWPTSTNVHCYWCCSRFPGTPVGLPVRYTSGTAGRDQFHVTGCFCSLECATAYNFGGGKDSVDECLHRYTLINALAARLGLGRSIRPAPDRVALAMFGGHMTIDEFRAFPSSGKHIMVNSHPMITVTQQLEEVNEADLRSEYRYIPLDNERVVRYQEKMRLKRVKPLVNFKNTLDHTMKVKYAS